MLDYLLRPFSYLEIEHRQKWLVDWLMPIILAVASTAILAALSGGGGLSMFGDNGPLARVLGFVQSLPGFYIAALAAIATFNKPDIDRHMPEPAPMLDISVQGRSVPIKLTRRRFLCAMFAFLTAESILIVILAIFGLAAAASVKAITPIAWQWVPKYLYLAVVSLVFWQMIVATFWGLYYLGEKLHQPDQIAPSPGS
jgi:hypothetical protein